MQTHSVLNALCVAVGFLIGVVPALAQHRTEAVGGIGTTGARYEFVTSGYVTGIVIKQYNYVEAIAPYYAQVDANGGIGPSQLGRGAGGPGGYDGMGNPGAPAVEKTFRCAPGAVVVGLRITEFMGRVGNVDILCENLQTGFRTYVKTDWVEPAQSGRFTQSVPTYQGDDMNCISGQAAAGFHGRVGQVIETLGLVCKRLPRPEAGSPPPPERIPGGSDMPVIREVGKSRICNEYGTRAVALAEQAERCGLTGGRFSARYDDHFQFCMGSSRTARDAEEKARTDALAACGAATGSGKDGYCKSYALEAVEQSNRARNAPLNCGLNGPRYDATYWQHFGWCQQVPQNMAEAEIRARDTEIKACVSCRDWAARALDQFKRANACTRPLPRWEARWQTKSADDHFRFCFMAQPGGLFGVNGVSAQHAIARDGDLSMCR